MNIIELSKNEKYELIDNKSINKDMDYNEVLAVIMGYFEGYESKHLVNIAIGG